jgi:hypothetical protein
MKEASEDFRAFELERTEALLTRIWPLIDRDEPDLKVVDTYLRV